MLGFKPLLVVAAVLALALAGVGLLLKQSIAREAVAKQVAESYRTALAEQARETVRANDRLARLDTQFKDLQAKKAEIRTVTKKEIVYIKQRARADEKVAAYLDAPVPDAISCLLADTCGAGEDGAGAAP